MRRKKTTRAPVNRRSFVTVARIFASKVRTVLSVEGAYEKVWIPETEREILAAAEAGDLAETATFDAKAALPALGKSRDLAVDVAAMASDGGTLLYGIGEDKHDRLTVPTPFKLAGVAERVDQIVRTCISEPPDVQLRPIPTEDDPAVGYLVIIVPASPRAPHMVTVGGHNRYYGRGSAMPSHIPIRGVVAYRADS